VVSVVLELDRVALDAEGPSRGQDRVLQGVAFDVDHLVHPGPGF